MLDHVGYSVGDFAKSLEWYKQALAPLGYSVLMGGDGYAGLGANGKPDFWLNAGGKHTPHVHIAFVAPNRAAVDAFYAAAIAAGGTDNGKPGLRAHYHAGYYGAFVLDPDGHNVEAVSHRPE